MDLDPELLEHPPVGRPLSASGSEMPEFVQDQADQVAVGKEPGRRARADGPRGVSDVHERPVALPRAGMLDPEPRDLGAADREPDVQKPERPKRYEPSDPREDVPDPSDRSGLKE